MKKNAFTLIELIAVVTILAIILLVSLPALTSTLKNMEEKSYNEYLNDLYMAAENYVVVSPDLFPELSYVNGSVFIQTSTLISNGYVDSNKINPKTETKINGAATIKITRNLDNSYGYNYFEGDYTKNGYSSSSLLLMYDGYNITGNTIKDLANNNDAVMVNFNDGWQGNSILFDGVDDYLNSTFSTSSTSLTFQFVIRYQDKDSDFYIYSKSSSTPSLLVNSDSYLYLNSDSLVSTDNSNKILYLTVVVDASGSTMYLNNQVLATSPIGGTAGTYRLFSNAGISTFKGNVYAVRVYEKVLTSEELLNNYNLDTGRYN